MIDVASRATNGVKIPGRKATRGEIKCMFKDHLVKLKAKLAVRDPIESLFFAHHFSGPNCPRRSQLDM
jgi:hypothetical protein